MNSRKKCPKEFWSYINGQKPKSVIPITLDDLKVHFAKLGALNSTDNDEEMENEFDALLNSFCENEFTQSILNGNFTVDELSNIVKTLKTGKAAGGDGIINEVIIHTFEKLKSVWCCLFNKILNTGELPSDWLNGLIIPIYKNKGERNDPGNYRGITLLSCSAKFFTAVLNDRLRKFSETFDLLAKNQAGFRPNHSTVDHIFVLKTLCDLMRNRKRKLYCAFVDYEKAFDKVWHLGLWVKLLRMGIGGNFIQVLINMYKGISSCISSHNAISDSFNILQGVRQGENLSPFLFALYVNDLEDFLKSRDCRAVDIGLSFDDRISDYLKFLLILYADDTVIFGDSEVNLQKALDSLFDYCKMWKLSVNCDKTKILIFGGRKLNNQYPFELNGQSLEHVSSYKYLGLVFNFNGKFNVGVKQLKDQGRRAMFALLQKCRQLQLPVSVQLELFNSLVRPILTYGSEVWGYNCLNMIESLHLEFCKYILYMKKSTPSFFVYGELGCYPLHVHVYSRMISFWHRLTNDVEKKMSSSILKTLSECFDLNIYKSEWLSKIKQILDDCGLSYVWHSPSSVSTKWLTNAVNTNLKDTYIQLWYQQSKDSSKACNYYLFKPHFEFEQYIDDLPLCYRIAFTKFRTANHKLPVEKGRYTNIQREQRTCNLCDSDHVGDEYHFLLECPALDNLRNKFIPAFYRKHPNFYKYSQLLSFKNGKKLLNLCKFIKEGLTLFK